MMKKKLKKKSKEILNDQINTYPRKDNSPIIPQRSKFKGNLSIFERQLTPHQLQFLEIANDKNTKIMFVAGPAGSSKAQPLDSDVLTSKGWVKMGDITLEDLVIGDDGCPHKVISIHPQGEKNIYKIEFSDGTFSECTLDHLWKTQTSNDRNQRKWTKTINGKRTRYRILPKNGSVKTTGDILNTLYVKNKSILNHSIPITKPIIFERKNHIITPYIMGALLGDGCFRKNGYVSFSSNDNEVIKRISDEIDNSMRINWLSKFDFSIVHKLKKDSLNGNIIKNEIKKLKLDNLYSSEKFIPKEYLFDSIENRINLLKGLMDTDGHVTQKSGCISYTTTSQQLCKDVRFLVESLGGVCSINTHKNFYIYLNEKLKGKDSYHISICLPPEIHPFHLKRKSELVVPKTKYRPIRYITNVVPIGKKECQCILIDNPTHLYLTNNCIVTHNTYISVLHALKMINEKKVSDLIYIRSAVESADSKLGFLPGEADEKMAPYLQPLLDKLIELLPKSDIDSLEKDDRFCGIPVGFLRGLNWNAKVVIADECQNMTFKELVTLVTRTGEFSKVFILGDPEQSDINGKSGFTRMMNMFDDEDSRKNGIFVFRFNEEDIVRSGLVRYIINKLRFELISKK